MSPVFTHRLPVWFKQEIPDNNALGVNRLLAEFSLRTVCQDALCPNMSYCFKNKELTFLILGNRCSRSCSFCNISLTQGPFLEGPFLESDEACRISRLVRRLDLSYVVITSVTRDDLTDGGAGYFAEVIKEVKGVRQDIKVEALIPDFQGVRSSIQKVVEAQADVIGHNLETVPRLYPAIRPQADYWRSLQALRSIKEIDSSVITKSALMVGLGERDAEVIAVLGDLLAQGCDIVVIGQYLAPSSAHYPVEKFVRPEQFYEYEKIALALGFRGVISAPKARSSFKAEEVMLSYQLNSSSYSTQFKY